MVWPFKTKPTSFLGIDIGTSAIRIVELSKYGDQEKLENYACFSVPYFHSNPLRTMRKGSLVLPTEKLAEMVSQALKEAKIETKKAIFSIPDFSTLFTTFTLPPMAEEEVGEAVKFEARRHVPLPLSEVTLDWLITKGEASGQRRESLEILLVVVPNRVIDQYTEIAELCHLELVALEAEVFALQRALFRKNKGTVCLIEIGAQSTTCSIVDENVLRFSHSFDVAGNDLTERLTRAFGVSHQEAETMKQNQGLTPGEKDLKEILAPSLDIMTAEIKKVIEIFFEKEGRNVSSCSVAGSSGSMPGIKEYFFQSLGIKTEIAFPFASMVYPSILEDELKKIGPNFAIAVGVALKGLE